MNAEKIKQLRDLVFVCREVGDNTAELFEYLANLLESIDKAEPVAEITRNPSWDMFSNVNAVKRLPVGTKLYTHPPKQEKTVFEQLKTQMKNDADYAWQARAKHDEPVGVARTNTMLKQGDTFCVFELGSVPEGTKLYTRPQPAKVTPDTAVVPDEIETAYGLDEQSEYAKGWNDCRAEMLKGEK